MKAPSIKLGTVRLNIKLDGEVAGNEIDEFSIDSQPNIVDNRGRHGGKVQKITVADVSMICGIGPRNIREILEITGVDDVIIISNIEIGVNDFIIVNDRDVQFHAGYH